jgi:glutathione S-transferase
LISRQLRTYHASQPLKRSRQVFGVHLLQVDRNRYVEQFVSVFLRLVFPMREQTTAEDPCQAEERPTTADRAFVTLAVADHLAIKAKDRIPELKATYG